jgi:[protein-PII] uridylyltransferase
MELTVARRALADDTALVGRDLCRAYSDLVDTWLAELFTDVVGASGADDVALVAVGGYGRAELSLQSDIDVVLLHGGRSDIGAVADGLWYPIWDEGLKLGHAVRTIREALALASDDLDTATSLLQVRHLAGDEDLTDELAGRALDQWRKRSKRWLADLSSRVAARHEVAGEVAYLLEPDLKEGRGGLRDVHALRWAEAARSLLWEGDDPAIVDAYRTLLSARVELHRRTERPGDRLLLEEQDAVAAALQYANADDLMRDVATAARTIAWRSDDAWSRIDASLSGPLGFRSRRDKALGDGIVLRDGEIHLTAYAEAGEDPSLVLRAAAAAAAADVRINRGSLDRMAASIAPLPEPWPEPVRSALIDLLLAGHRAIPVIEALDQLGLWEPVFPEWSALRCKPQRNAYHRFTVDRHLWEAAANAAALTRNVRRPDLLLVGALLHDIGKGFPGDHTEAGIDVVGRVAPRLGFVEADVRVLQELVRMHLLLPDVATRRDLADPATIEHVAREVGDVDTLELLAALTEADSLATGTSAWSDWKAGLVAELVSRVRAKLLGAAMPAPPEPDSVLDVPADLEEGLHGDGHRCTVVASDRPGLFSKVAGVLALHGLDVRSASAGQASDGRAVEVFEVEPAFGKEPQWDRVDADLRAVLEGRLTLADKLIERSRSYARRYRRTAARPADPRVLFDNDASERATVIEVRAPDGVAVLHRITTALANCGLDVRLARVSTMGHEVVDAFYVTDRAGAKVLDDEALDAVESAVLRQLRG